MGDSGKSIMYTGNTSVPIADRPEPCPPGQEQEASPQGQCTPCQLGKFNPIADGLCLTCSPGTSGGMVGMSACKVCPVGTYTDGAGMSECAKCPPGAAATQMGMSACAVGSAPEMTCGQAKEAYRRSSCCGMPTKTFNWN